MGTKRSARRRRRGQEPSNQGPFEVAGLGPCADGGGIFASKRESYRSRPSSSSLPKRDKGSFVLVTCQRPSSRVWPKVAEVVGVDGRGKNDGCRGDFPPSACIDNGHRLGQKSRTRYGDRLLCEEARKLRGIRAKKDAPAAE